MMSFRNNTGIHVHTVDLSSITLYVRFFQYLSVLYVQYVYHPVHCQEANNKIILVHWILDQTKAKIC